MMSLIQKYLTPTNKRIGWVFLFFSIAFALVSIVNHVLFRTYGHDLGIYTHGIYMYSHFKMHVYTLAFESEMLHLGNHFSPIVLLLSPLYYLFGHYTLLLVQIVFILLGGLGIYRIAEEQLRFKSIPLLLMIQFFCMWGIYSALSFDFHTNVLAAMMAPWFVLYFNRGKMLHASILFALILLTKENMALWMVFILFGLIIKKRFDREAKSTFGFSFLLMGIAALYFVAVQNWIMPLFDPGMKVNHLNNYGALGNSLSEIVVNLLSDPWNAIKLLFVSDDPNPKYDYIKLMLHGVMFLSGGFAVYLRPYYLVMLAPIYAQKFFSTNMMHWGIDFHYSIEILPIISMALIDFLKNKNQYKTKWTIGTVIFLTLATTIHTMNERESYWYNKTNNSIFYGKHYKAHIDLQAVKDGMVLIPDGARVCAHSALVPRLANRERIYHFPMIKDAEYIALLKKGRSNYPVPDDKYAKMIEQYRTDTNMELLFEEGEMIIFKVLEPATK